MHSDLPLPPRWTHPSLILVLPACLHYIARSLARVCLITIIVVVAAAADSAYSPIVNACVSPETGRPPSILIKGLSLSLSLSLSPSLSLRCTFSHFRSHNSKSRVPQSFLAETETYARLHATRVTRALILFRRTAYL